MKKKMLALLFAVLLCVLSVVPAFAASEYPLIIDDAGLLSDSQLKEIEDKLDKVSKETKIDITILTVDSLDGMSPEEFAQYYYEVLDYSEDGIILLLSMEYRDVNVSSFGEYGKDVFSTSKVDSIREEITPDLSDGEYFDAFDLYIDLADDAVYDANHFNIWFNLLIAIGVGLVVALIIVLIMKSQLKSVRYQSAASNYLKEGSMHVTAAHERFLYRHVDRIKIEKQSSSSGSSNSSSGKF